MGIDLLALQGTAIGLLVSFVYSYAYVRFLGWLAQKRGVLFFWPGFLTGILGFLILNVLLQYSGAVAWSVPFAEVSLGRAILWSIAPAITASWLASRSTLKTLRVSITLGAERKPTGRALGAFWIGVGIVLLSLLVWDFLQVART